MLGSAGVLLELTERRRPGLGLQGWLKLASLGLGMLLLPPRVCVGKGWNTR